MKYMKKIILMIFIVNLSACTVFIGSPVERVVRFDDSELCSELADKTFKYHAAWSWAISDEIKKRELDKTDRCKAVYTSRITRIMRKLNAVPVSFEDALNIKLQNE